MRCTRWLVFLVTILIANTVRAQSESRELAEIRVATRLVSPLVIQDKNGLTGFSIELWNELAKRLKLKTKYEVNDNVKALLESVRDKKAELGVSAISITSEREASFDFSQPILNAGLLILVPGRAGTDGESPLRGLLRLLFSPIILVWLGIALVLIILPAHVLWFLERKDKNSIIPTEKYFPGIFHALWWAAGTLATQADEMPRNWLARIMATLWMFTSVAFVAYYTAQLTASLTVEQIHGRIAGPDDLPGKVVATTRGSTAAKHLAELNANVKEFDTIDSAYAALLDNSAEAVVFDAPVLLFYVKHEGSGRVRTVGPVFHREDYGIVFPASGTLRKKVDRALLAMREDGTYQQLYDKWFGTK